MSGKISGQSHRGNEARHQISFFTYSFWSKSWNFGPSQLAIIIAFDEESDFQVKYKKIRHPKVNKLFRNAAFLLIFLFLWFFHQVLGLSKKCLERTRNSRDVSGKFLGHSWDKSGRYRAADKHRCEKEWKNVLKVVAALLVVVEFTCFISGCFHHFSTSHREIVMRYNDYCKKLLPWPPDELIIASP